MSSIGGPLTKVKKRWSEPAVRLPSFPEMSQTWSRKKKSQNFAIISGGGIPTAHDRNKRGSVCPTFSVYQLRIVLGGPLIKVDST